jgi:hypothetical protein
MTLGIAMANETDNDPWAGVTLTEHCEKCHRKLPHKEIAPALCAKCDLVNSLLVERYTTHVRAPEVEDE